MASTSSRKPSSLGAAVRPIASLNPSLLARKGGARPAMRHHAHAIALDSECDLGWNDFGAEFDAPHSPVPTQVVPITGRAGSKQRRSRALDRGGKAAFTLRLDAERHMKLRLACTLDDRSAQALVTDALDRMLSEMPDLQALADKVGTGRKS